MRKLTSIFRSVSFVMLILCLTQNLRSIAQCTNADLEAGNFSSWTGTYGTGSLFSSGGATNWPYLNTGFNQGANNAAPNSTPEKNQFIMTSGFDANVGGTSLPVVSPLGGTTSMRLGNFQANGGGETVSYSFTVGANNTNFTYHYAVVLNSASGHSTAEQPYFKIRMYDGSGAVISCASYDVDGLTAPTIGGFITYKTDEQYKPWSSVTIPLNNYIGQTVKVTFETRDCAPAGVPGTHWAYAYVDAGCQPLEIIPSSPSVCPGQNITLTAPIGAATYSWTGPSPGSIVSGGNTNVATVNAPGTYTVSMTTIGSTPCTYALTATMPANLPGSGVTVNSATICAGASATLTASGGGPYTWAPNGETTTSITVTPGSTTSYSVSGGTCPSTGVGTVTVIPLPTSPFTVTPACVGAGSTITYTGNASSTDTYAWNFGGGTIISGSGQGPYSVSWPTSGSENVTLQVTVGTCVSPVTTNAVTVNPPPTVTVSPTTVCEGITGTITAGGASTYLWSNSTAGASLSDAPLATTSYTVTGTDANGCTGTAVGTITINPMQDPAFSYTPSTICKTGGSDPTPVITGTTGGTFTCSPALTINASSGVIDLASAPLGSYTVTYTTPGPCPASGTFNISIVNVPVADFTYGVYCQNVNNPAPTYINGGSAGVFTAPAGLVFVSPVTTPGEVDLMASTAGNYIITNTIAASGGCPAVVGSNTITINAVPVTTVDDQPVCTGSSATLTAGGATSYVWSDGSSASTLTDAPVATKSYTVTGTTANCSSSAVGTITVNPVPTSPFTVTPVCEGAGSTITYTGNAPANATYTWDFAGGTVISGSGQGPYSVSWPTSGSPNVTLTVALGTCTSPLTTVPVTVNPIPVVSVNDAAICPGNSATLTANGATTYSWSTGSAANPLIVSPVVNTSYTVTGTTAGCSATAVANVAITPLPILTVNSTVICEGQSATLNAAGGSTYTWSTGQTGSSITVSPATTTSYTVSDNTAGCSGSASGTVTVNSVPVVTVNAVTICEGQSASLTAAGANTYLWSTGSATNPLTVSPATTTPYTVTGSTAAGCTGTAMTTVTVNPLPVITVNSTSICEGLSSTLTASGGNSYVWSNGAVTASITVSPTTTTPYTVTGTSAAGCSAAVIGTVTIFKKPGAQFSTSPNPARMFNPVINFNNQSSADVNYWFWSFGDGDSLDDNSTNPTHTYPGDTGSYNAVLIVHNAGFCYDTINHLVLIGPEYAFYIPNAFTPDGDDINDTFFGEGIGILEYRLMIFDRWGNFIFTADDIDKGWDGKANGGANAAQQDVYVWKVELTDIFHKKHNYVGTVTIVRGNQ